MSRSSSMLAIAALFATGCSEFNLSNKTGPDAGAVPDIFVDPPALTYGRLATGDEEIQTFTVQNIGAATLNVSDIVIGSGLAFTVLGPETVFDLEPSETMSVDVAFTPMGADENFGQVLVLSDDPDTPEAPVDLLGLGAVPELKITPDSYVFADTFIPCGAFVDLTLENVGSENLVISDLAYRSGGLLTLDDSALRPQLPVTLAPGETRQVRVNFQAVTAGSDTGMLEVTSNDPRGVVTADQNGEGAYADENTEVFTEPGIPSVDVMMLIDQSGSMESDNQDDITNGIPPFLAELQNVSDWQLLQVTDLDGCGNGGILTPTTPGADSLLINNAFPGVPPFGGNYFLTESLLQLASLALEQMDPGECNAGFLRPGSLLHIIVMSDEPEQSGQSYLHWLGDYGSYVPSPDFVKVSAVVDINNNCGLGGAGYIEAANATGGAVLNICNSNWGSQLSNIASEVLAGIRTYNLAEPADPNTVVVTVNGTPTSDISVNGDSVTINSPPVGEGDVVEITYAVLAECN